jgi:hypothetical protein
MRPTRNGPFVLHSAVAFRLLLGLAVCLELAPTSARADEFYRFERMWPMLPQPRYFGSPLNGLAFDKDGSLYVADYDANCIQEFTSDGKLITKRGRGGVQRTAGCCHRQSWLCLCDRFQ